MSELYYPDTIAAQATPPGKGGVGIIRISGLKAKEIAKKITKKKLTPRKAIFTKFLGSKGEMIDEGLALFFPGPHSFTGEDVVELQGHGGPVVMDQLLEQSIQAGARLANPGEFSQRAFLNNKMDLAQAEAVADLINASSKQAARAALKSLQGDFSRHINYLVDLLTQLRMMVEASIDFPEEEIDFLSENNVMEKVTTLIKKVTALQKTAQQGVLLQEGMTVVIVGKPNAGKSSLLNCLSGQDVAIVTDIAGTTRDTLREYIHIDGMPLHIIDTAGFHESDNVVELEGMRRARKAVETADLILLIIDASKETNPNTKLISSEKPRVIIKNKIDLINQKPSIKKEAGCDVIGLSAKHQQGIELLKEYLKALMDYSQTQEGTFMARRRHLEAVAKAKTFLMAGQKQLNENHSGELLAEDLRLAQKALGEITGEVTSDDLLGKIFSTFCIGK